MADEIVTFTWCDVHQQEHHEKVDASEHKTTITVDGLTRRLDLCPECHSTLLGPVLDRMNAYGTRDDARPPGKVGRPRKDPLRAAEEDPLPLGGRIIYDTSDPVTVLDVVVQEDGRTECLFCLKTLGSTTGVYRHMETEHEVDLPTRLPTAQWRAEHPEVDVEALLCPEHQKEGQVFLARAGQGLGAHRRTAHEVIGSSDFATRHREAHAA